MRRIVIAGCGPGAPEYVTPAVLKAVGDADVLVGAIRLLELFPSHRGEKIAVGADIEKILKEIDARRGQKRIAVLVTGDPGLCSLARPIIVRFGMDACEVIPGISSVQVAFARIGLDWLDARIIDAHGASPDIDTASLIKEGKIAVFCGRKDAITWTAKLMERLGTDRRAYLCENLTLGDEKIRQVKAADLAAMEVSSRSIILIIKEDFLK